MDTRLKESTRVLELMLEALKSSSVSVKDAHVINDCAGDFGKLFKLLLRDVTPEREAQWPDWTPTCTTLLGLVEADDFDGAVGVAKRLRTAMAPLLRAARAS